MRESACLLCRHPTHDLPPPLMARILLAFLHTLGGGVNSEDGFSCLVFAAIPLPAHEWRRRPALASLGPTSTFAAALACRKEGNNLLDSSFQQNQDDSSGGMP